MKNYNTFAQPLYCSLNLFFSDVPVPLAVVVFLNSLLMVAWADVCLVQRPRSNQRRPFLADMADCEVTERFWLSQARIEWLTEELKEELERNTVISCKER